MGLQVSVEEECDGRTSSVVRTVGLGEFARLLGVYLQAAQSMQGKQFKRVRSVGCGRPEHLALKLLSTTSHRSLPSARHARLTVSDTDNSLLRLPLLLGFPSLSLRRPTSRSTTSSSRRVLMTSGNFAILSGHGEVGWTDSAVRQTPTRLALFSRPRGSTIEISWRRSSAPPHSSALPPKRQKEARRGQWRFNKGWADLADMAGKNKKYFASLYAYLSSYAHSGYLSALQIGQAEDKQNAIGARRPHLGIWLTLLSHFLTDYGALFPPVAEAIERNPDDKRLVDLWQAVGDNMGQLYAGDDGRDGSA